MTWNVAGRVTRQPEQAQVLAAAAADVVALQEVTARTLPLWRAALADAGYSAIEATLDDPPAAPRRRLLDAFRTLQGYDGRHASWTFAHDRGGWRLDHVLVDGLRPVAAAYAHEWRRSGLSDHSALVVDLELSERPPTATATSFG